MSAALPVVPLPADWPESAKSGLLHAIALARIAMTYVRGWCLNSRIQRVRLLARAERSDTESVLLREEARILRARVAVISAPERPRYPPAERLAILELKAARGWNNAQTARAFLVSAATIASWLERIDEQGPHALVQIPVPVNRFPDFVAYLVQKLRSLEPTLGRVRIAQLLARIGLRLSATTVRRLLQRIPPPKPPARPATTAPFEETADHEPQRTVTARYPHHVWNLDLTLMPTAAGFWVPWAPLAVLPFWPFCWWILVVLDHYSRRTVGFEVFRKQPTSAAVCAALDGMVARIGRAPKYTVSDQGVQFQEPFREWCKAHGVRPRFGAVAKHGSIAVTERFILTLKQEALRRILVPLGLGDMRLEVAAFLGWYDEYRPHQGLGGRTPAEVYEGRAPANATMRFETRPRLAAARSENATGPPARVVGDGELELVVTHLEGRKHLPIVDLRIAA
jgi:transposase InsO family protein